MGLVLALKPGEADLSLRLLERPSGREIARKGQASWDGSCEMQREVHTVEICRNPLQKYDEICRNIGHPQKSHVNKPALDDRR